VTIASRVLCGGREGLGIARLPGERRVVGRDLPACADRPSRFGVLAGAQAGGGKRPVAAEIAGSVSNPLDATRDQGAQLSRRSQRSAEMGAGGPGLGQVSSSVSVPAHHHGGS
jgi:hypothetical protein